MPPKKRGRSARQVKKSPPEDNTPRENDSKRLRKSYDRDHSSVSDDDAQVRVLGGVRGDYRLTGREDVSTSSDRNLAAVSVEIAFGDRQIVCQEYHSSCTTQSHDTRPAPALIFTHGAGGGIANPATADFARGFARSTTTPSVALFQGTMNLESRVKTFARVLDHYRQQFKSKNVGIALGGRSMGARAAVIAATNDASTTTKVNKLVLVSYPLLSATSSSNASAATSKDKSRTDILLKIPSDIKVLFITGSNDALCPLDLLGDVRRRLKAKSWSVVVQEADHGMGASRGRKQKPGMTKTMATALMRQRTGALAARWVGDTWPQKQLHLRFDAEHDEIIEE